MKQDAPKRLLIITVVSVVLLNVVLAQVIAQRLYPGNGLQLGPTMLAALALVAVASAVSAILQWRAYLRR